MFFVLFILYILLSTCGMLLIKLGGSGTSIEFATKNMSMQFSYQLIIGLFCYIVSFLLFTIILQKKDLSIIYPICAGVVNVVTVLLGVFVLKEKISPLGITGVAFTVLGIILLNIRR